MRLKKDNLQRFTFVGNNIYTSSKDIKANLNSYFLYINFTERNV